VGCRRHAPAALPREIPGTQCIGGWVGHRTGVENLAPIGIGSPDRPARSELVHRLNYAGPPYIFRTPNDCCLYLPQVQLRVLEENLLM
jgi:hypothetical protein